MLQVMFKVSPSSLLTFIDTPNCVLEEHVQYSTVHIPNVFCDGGHLQIINCACCNRHLQRDILITLYFTYVFCVYQFTRTGQKASDRSEAHRSLQNCGSAVWNLLRFNLVAPSMWGIFGSLVLTGVLISP